MLPPAVANAELETKNSAKLAHSSPVIVRCQATRAPVLRRQDGGRTADGARAPPPKFRKNAGCAGGSRGGGRKIKGEDVAEGASQFSEVCFLCRGRKFGEEGVADVVSRVLGVRGGFGAARAVSGLVEGAYRVVSAEVWSLQVVTCS